MIGAIVVATVLIVGGALFFLAGDDDSGTTSGNGTTVGIDAVTTPPTLVSTSGAPSTLPPTTLPPTTLPPTTLPPTTLPPTTLPPTTLAPTPVAPTAPPPTAPPPTIAPLPTAPTSVGSLTFDQAAAFFREYIDTAIRGDYVAAWNRLSDRDQLDYDGGFDQFVGFWQSVSFADVQRIDSLGGGTGFQSMRANMAYGQVDGDPTSFEVIDVDVNVRPDGTLQIFDYRFIGTQ